MVDISVKDEEEFSESSGKPNYIGRVTDVDMMGEHPITGTSFDLKGAKGEDKLLVIVIEPQKVKDPEEGFVDAEWSDQTVIMNPNVDNTNSKFYGYNKALKELGISNFDYLLRKEFEFEDREVKTPSGTQHIDVPVREIERREADEI